MGDPDGVGPEIVVKSLMNRSVYESSNPIVVGDAGVIRQVVNMLHLSFSVNAVF